MADKRRIYKVSERIREIIASALPKTADPRFTLVTITSVVLSSDLREAKIYWTAPDAKDRLPEFERAFKKATGFFRKLVGDGLDIRFVPNLHFLYDNTLDTYDKVQELMARISKETEKNLTDEETVENEDENR